MIEILYIENKEPLLLEEIKIIEALLSEREVQKASRYRRWQDKQAFLLGKMLVATHLVNHKYHTKLLGSLSYTDYNRPYIKDTNIDFNISHSGQYVICAFSLDQSVGIDIEEMQFIDLKDLSYILNKTEKERVENSANRHAAFFRIWSAKEAILKAHGFGLVNELDKLEIYDDTGLFDQTLYYLKPFALHPAYATIVASSTPIEQINIEEVFIKDCLEIVHLKN